MLKKIVKCNEYSANSSFKFQLSSLTNYDSFNFLKLFGSFFIGYKFLNIDFSCYSVEKKIHSFEFWQFIAFLFSLQEEYASKEWWIEMKIHNDENVLEVLSLTKYHFIQKEFLFFFMVSERVNINRFLCFWKFSFKVEEDSKLE